MLGARGYDRSLVLGDLVGYGADPNRVIEAVQALEPAAVVRGNHDKVACGLEQAEGFNAVAKSAARWTLDELTPGAPRVARRPAGGADGGRRPDRDLPRLAVRRGRVHLRRDRRGASAQGVDARRSACSATRTTPRRSSSPTASSTTWDDRRRREAHVALRDGAKYLVNPGSVGQPRDGDPRAAYAIVDTGAKRIELFRVDYPIAQAQAKVIKAGLPDVLAQRLAVGR